MLISFLGHSDGLVHYWLRDGSNPAWAASNVEAVPTFRRKNVKLRIHPQVHGSRGLATSNVEVIPSFRLANIKLIIYFQVPELRCQFNLQHCGLERKCEWYVVTPWTTNIATLYISYNKGPKLYVYHSRLVIINSDPKQSTRVRNDWEVIYELFWI
jgi:hypothetical protein